MRQTAPVRSSLLPIALGLSLVGLHLATSARAAEPDLPDAWWSNVREQIQAQEYEVTWQNKTVLADVEAAYQAPNRAHGFRTYFTRQGPRVVPRTERPPSWKWGLELLRIRRRGARAGGAKRMEPVPDTNEAIYDRGGVVERYVNDRRGIEQLFTIYDRPEGPPGANYVHVDMRLAGTLQPMFSSDGRSISFVDGTGVLRVFYAHLHVYDASGTELDAWMEGFGTGRGRGIRLVFDDRDATYPVTVDPLATSPAWTYDGDQADARLGGSLATAGDVDGDGYSDVLVAAWKYDAGQTGEGKVFLFEGSPSGLSATPAWEAEGDQTGAEFGVRVSTAADVNGDGFADVVIGATGFDDDQVDEGRAYMFRGSASGLESTPAWTADGDQAECGFGLVSTAGDVNGDRYSDVVVGAPDFDAGQVDEGRAFVYHGSPSGLSDAAAWTAEGDQADAAFGVAVSTAGDVDGDGFGDLVVGARYYDAGEENEGRAFLYRGSSTGLSAIESWSAQGDLEGAQFGFSAGTAGDLNGDGYSDVVVGAPLDTAGFYDNEGSASVFYGSTTGLPTTPDWEGFGEEFVGFYGISVMTAGDVNGDGYADLAVGATGHDGGETDEGAAYVYYGSDEGLLPYGLGPDWSVESNQEEAQMGIVAPAGDVNGDGFADLLVGAEYYDDGEVDEGRAYVYHGAPAGLDKAAGWHKEGDQEDAQLRAVALAGDVNGDGYDDVAVGIPGFDTGVENGGRAHLFRGSSSGLSSLPAWTVEGDESEMRVGFDARGAGDVNGDGYDDLVVGATRPLMEGLVFVYHGSPSGLPDVASWSAESPHPGTHLGFEVGTAGDVNGDGFADIFASAPHYAGEDGLVRVFLGSSEGLESEATWVVEETQDEARFGDSVSSAGDVDGDGYSDLVVGEPLYDGVEDDQGRALVYLGSASGLEAVASWTVTGDQRDTRLGSAVSGAGDTNGDGYADVIVGAEGYDIDSDPLDDDYGAAFLYEGSVSGLSPDPDWTVEGDGPLEELGLEVTGAGDVNGDGYADVAVTEFDVLVYLGSASGLGTSPSTTLDNPQAPSNFGHYCAPAGDVNGDGYAELGVSAQLFEDEEPQEGKAFVYFGNRGEGVSLVPQQRRVDDSSPIGLLGKSDAEGSFRLRMGRAGSPFGRGRVRVELEAEVAGVPFDGADTVITEGWSDTGIEGADLTDLIDGLESGELEQWRMRVLYDPAVTPFAQRSRWITNPSGSWLEPDLRMGGWSVRSYIGDLGFLDDEVTLTWSDPGGEVDLYDTARFVVETIRMTGGDYSNSTCLENDGQDLQTSAPSKPGAASSFGYLVRVDGDSWDTPRSSQKVSRDATMAACP